MTNRYYTDEDQQNLIYFQFPKLLMYAEKYKKMSGDAKLLYMICSDLIKLSMKRPDIWKDPEKGYFIKLSNQSIQDKMNCKNEKATKLLKELEKFDLLENVRMGQGKSNRLFVKKLEFTDSDIYKANQEHEEMENDELSTESPSSKTDGGRNPEKPESRIRKNRNQESGKTGDKNPEKPELLRSILNKNDFSNNDFNKNFNSLSIHEFQLINDILAAYQFSEKEREKILIHIHENDLQISIEAIKNQCKHMHLKNDIIHRVTYFINGITENQGRTYYKPSRQIQDETPKRKVPFYNWLEDDGRMGKQKEDDLPY